MDDAAGPVRYVTSQGFGIAWQAFGSGPDDLCFLWGNPNHLETLWELPTLATFLRGLGRLGRVAHFDQRGTGLSDRVADTDLPDLAARARDAVAVMDAAGMERVTLIGESEGAACAVRAAATFPERVERLILLSPAIRGFMPEELREELLDLIEANWGEPLMVELQFPSNASDPRFCDWYSRLLRRAASPGQARAMVARDQEVNEMATLASVAAPTLVLSHTDDPLVPADELREVAELLPDGRLVLVPGVDRTFGSGPGDDLALQAIADFLGLDPSLAANPDRLACSILFTDIVGSTDLVRSLGDKAWRSLLDVHDRILTELIHRGRGDWVKSTGDGTAATFRTADDAVAVALAAREELAAHGLEVRAGVHVGTLDRRGDDIAGMDVHVAARIADRAGAGQVLVSGRAAEDLDDRHALTDDGSHDLKGVPGTWRLWQVDLRQGDASHP